MSAASHDRFREMTAAYVLGALDADERTELDLHLAACDECRADIVDFAALPSFLARLDVSDVDDVGDDGATAATADAVVTAVRDDLARLRRSRRRWQVLAGAAAVVAVVAGVVAVLAGDGDRGGRRATGVALDVEATAEGAAATVVADPRAWGTYVYVDADGLPVRDTYAVWVVDVDGTWEPAGTWAPTPDASASLGASTAVRLEDIDRIVVTSLDRTDELLVAR